MDQYTDYTDEEWFSAVAGPEAPDQGSPLFNLPRDELQTRTVGRSGRPVMRDAFMFWQFCRQMLVEHGNGISPDTKVMDFGCAWGRIIRFWLRDITAGNLYGFDVQDDVLKLAMEHVPNCNYQLNNATPPLNVPDETFDLIYAFSVFSHLPQSLADSWIEEFARLLKPGGIACLTTRPRAHIEVAGTEAAQGAHKSDYAKIIVDRQAALQRYDNGEFVFYPAHGGGVLSEETYGEAIIPEGYARRHWQLLTLIGYYKDYSKTYLQPCFILKKNGEGEAHLPSRK